jgi:hypothetical protein
MLPINPPFPKTKISKIRVVVRKRPANHREFAQNDIDIITTEKKKYNNRKRIKKQGRSYQIH